MSQFFILPENPCVGKAHGRDQHLDEALDVTALKRQRPLLLLYPAYVNEFGKACCMSDISTKAYAGELPAKRLDA
jgi:hypothetical protein